MSRTLEERRRPATSGITRSVVVFLHGYGADGADLLGIADAFSPHLPYTAFHAPDAPERSTLNPFGYQWFPIPWMDGSTEAQMKEGFADSAVTIDAYLDRILEREGITPTNLALFGFSQGAMMGLQVAPRRAHSVAAVVGISGRLLNPTTLANEAVSKPPVLLAHGDGDEVVPFGSLSEASNALTGAGFEVRTHVMEGRGHGISPEALGVTLGFIRERLQVHRE